MERRDNSGRNLLRLAGGFIAIFSVIMGMLVLFVIPGACSFLGGLELVVLFILFLLGGMAFAAGEVMSRKRKRATLS